MHLSPGGTNCSIHNSIHYTDLQLLLCLHPLFSILYSKLSLQNAIGYTSALLINSSVAYCIKVKSQILIWPTKTWINRTLPTFPASPPLTFSPHFRLSKHCASCIILSNALLLSVSMVEFFSRLLSIISPHPLPSFENSHCVGQEKKSFLLLGHLTQDYTTAYSCPRLWICS